MLSSSPTSESSLFDRLPARPPTPPRDVEADVEDALTFLREGHQVTTSAAEASETTAARTSTDTPPPKPSASLQQKGSGSTKKVDFSPWPMVHKIPAHDQSSSPGAHHQRQAPTSRGTKPLKSILKAAAAAHHDLPPTPDELKIALFSPEDPGSFRKMLYSVLRQLSSPSRDDRRDAYLALNNALKTYEGVPEPDAIIDRIDVLQQFLSRDIAWQDQSGRLDSSIVTQAMQLTIVILLNPQTTAAFDDDFRAFLVDRSACVLEQPDVAKAVVKSHAQLLAVQRFKSHVMTSSRIEKLLRVFRDLESRCSGNGIVAARLVVYQRLVELAPAIMLSHMRDWIEYVFHGMLSSITDIRIRAIDTCSRAAVLLGTQAQTAKVVLEVMETAIDDEKTYADFFSAQLLEMVKAKQTAIFVPRIWAAIILFFRCKRRPVDKWPNFRHWLMIIQKCLNNSDIEVKHHANNAWSKLVYATMPDENTTDALRSMLKVPIVAALDKRGNDKQSQQQRQIAMESYCNLLHYGLRPGLSYEDLDKSWDLYVEPVLLSMATSRSKGNVCRILQGLLKQKDGAWNRDAALESKTIKPEELPRTEPRWLRSRLGRFLKVLEPIMHASMWSPPHASKTVDDCWRLLLQNVSEAGAQEVKTSTELKDAIAQLTNFFRRLWFAHSSTERSDTEGALWIQRYQQLLKISVDTLGAGHFIEDILARTDEDEIEAAPTPSHRASKHAITPYSSAIFLFALYYQPRREILASRLYQESAIWFLRLLVQKKGSVSCTLGLLHRCLHFSTHLALDEAAAAAGVSARLWTAVADHAVEYLDAQGPRAPKDGTQIAGHALRSAIEMLAFGLRYADVSLTCSSKAVELYSVACHFARCQANDAGIAVGVMEPMAKVLVDSMDDISISIVLKLGAALFTHGTWPESRQEADQSRKALWTVNFETTRASNFEPFDHVYALLRSTSTRAYDRLQSDDAITYDLATALLASTSTFWQKCPRVLLQAALRQIQAGVVVWIEDRQRKIFPASGAFATLQSMPVVSFWSDLLKLIRSIPRKDSGLLLSLEPLLIAGLSSPSRGIVNATIDFWNNTFGAEETLEYPSQIQKVLSARRLEAHIELPSFPNDSNDDELPSFPVFAEDRVTSNALPDFGIMMPYVRSALKNTRPVENIYIRQHLAAHGHAFDTRASTSTPPARPTPKPRLRHDDSQIDFAPIESSAPTPTYEGSQLLTERQKDVQTRQRGDAQMFPELSSSPACSPAKPKIIAKRLDFSSEAESNGNPDRVVLTPTGLQEGNPMSDDLPSSPTPRATNAEAEKPNVAECTDDEGTICDPPSSPPCHADGPVVRRTVGPDDTTVVQSTYADATEVAVHKAGPRPINANRSNAQLEGSDLPSDTLLPTAQLKREAAAAAAAEGGSDVVEPVPTADGDEPKIQLTEANLEVHGERFETPSRIRDSMIREHIATAEAQGDTPLSSRSSKKRKRNTESVLTSKKRPKTSPFKRFLGYLSGSQPRDDDIGEEIVVAGSQARSSPVQDSAPAVLSSEREAELDHPASQEALSAQPAAPPKRKRGRPSKSECQQSSTGDQPAPRGTKRQASIVSADIQPSASIVRGTPAPAKKTRKSSRLSQDSVTEASSSGRRVVAVMPSPLKRLAIATETGEDDTVHVDESDVAAPAQQLVDEHSIARSERAIAQPKSILSRLRGVLDDCKKMVFGSLEEEREFDDVLFEIRREVHEASRRQGDQ